MSIVEEQQNQQPTNKLKRLHSTEPPSLPPEIVVEVLLRLSVESLLRCKSICKLWCTLISDPVFVKSHLRLSTNNIHYVHHRLIYSITFPGYKFRSCSLYDVFYDNSINNPLEEIYDGFVSIIGCCNGLLCIRIKYELFIWNPSIRISYMLPKYDLAPFVIDWYGFGYHESADDYKVVAIHSTKGGAESRKKIMRIYSLKTRNWKDIGDFPYTDPWARFSTFSNEAFHWMVQLNDSFPRVPSFRIISLDLGTETFAEVLQPVYDEGVHKEFWLGALGDWVCVVCNYGRIRSDVWAMKVYGVKDSWTKLFSIPYPTIKKINYISVPLCILNDGKFFLRYRRKLVLYDSKNTSFSEIHNDDGCVDRHTFVESLVSPTGLGR